MTILSFIEQGFSQIWVVIALAVAILSIGWILSRIILRITIRILHKLSFIKKLSAWLKQSDTTRLEDGICLAIRIIILLLTIWLAIVILLANPQINSAYELTRSNINDFFRLPAISMIIELFLIILIIFLIVKSFHWVKIGFESLAKHIRASRKLHPQGIQIQKLQLLDVRQTTNLYLSLTRFGRYAASFILLLIYLTGFFSIFPQTRGVVSDVLEDFLSILNKTWDGFLAYLPNLLNLALIVLGAKYSIKLIKFIFDGIGKKRIVISGFHPEWAETTFQLVRVAIIALALIIAFPFLPGSSSPAFQGISIFIGALFSLGSSSVVGNIVAGIVLTYTRAFQLGDRVQIANTVGDVIEKSLLVTRIKTIKNVEVAIPNSMVLASHIINFSSEAHDRGLILHTTVTIGYATPWRLIHQTLIKAALATRDILSRPKPFVLQTSLNDSYVSYELNAYTENPQRMADIYSDLHENIQDQCNEAGIEIMSPHYAALRDGNASTIPPDYLPKVYQPPSFKVDTSKSEDVS